MIGPRRWWIRLRHWWYWRAYLRAVDRAAHVDLDDFSRRRLLKRAIEQDEADAASRVLRSNRRAR